MPRVRLLITQNPNEELEPQHRVRLPRAVGWNLVKLVYQEFLKKNITSTYLRLECLDGVHPLLFSQLCIYYYADAVSAVVNEIQEEDGQVYTEEVTKNKEGKTVSKKTPNSTVGEDRSVGTVTICNDHQTICVSGSATITVLGKVSKLVTMGS